MPTVLQQWNVPDAIRRLTTMEPADYVDLFTVATDRAAERSPEGWARAAIGGAHPAARFLAWQVVLGLRLDHRPSPNRLAGWWIAERGDGWIRLEASSWFLTAHVVIHVDERQVSAATFIRYDRPPAALVWPPVSVVHRAALPGLLRHAARTLAR